MTMEVMEWQRLRAERQEKSKPWYSEQAAGVSLHINAWGFEGRISWNRLSPCGENSQKFREKG